MRGNEMASKKFTVRKFDGDTSECYAVFRAADLQGRPRGVVFYGDARPLVTGLSRKTASYYADRFEKEGR